MEKVKAGRNDAVSRTPAAILFIVGVVLFWVLPVGIRSLSLLVCIIAVPLAFHRGSVWRCTLCQQTKPRA